MAGFSRGPRDTKTLQKGCWGHYLRFCSSYWGARDC